MSMSFYPVQFQASAIAAHLISRLERRRASFEQLDENAQVQLTAEADGVLAQANAQFKEMADDEVYWAQTEAAVREVALGRYLKLAKEQNALENSGFGAWRRGDFVSRAAYAGLGLLAGLIIIRTPIPDWLEFLPVALFVFGPLIPDFQAARAKRKYTRALENVVKDLEQESIEQRTYAPVGEVASDDSISSLKIKEKA
jgi:hypothetical protein